MQYLLLLYHDEKQFQALSEEEKGNLRQEYFALIDELKQKGQYLGGNPLEPTATAKTVRVRGPKPVVTDGPFAETKEQLGGYYLVEAKDLDDAISIAARIPGAKHGSIEVRPIVKFS